MLLASPISLHSFWCFHWVFLVRNSLINWDWSAWILPLLKPMTICPMKFATSWMIRFVSQFFRQFLVISHIAPLLSFDIETYRNHNSRFCLNFFHNYSIFLSPVQSLWAKEKHVSTRFFSAHLVTLVATSKEKDP